MISWLKNAHIGNLNISEVGIFYSWRKDEFILSLNLFLNCFMIAYIQFTLCVHGDKT